MRIIQHGHPLSLLLRYTIRTKAQSHASTFLNDTPLILALPSM